MDKTRSWCAICNEFHPHVTEAEYAELTASALKLDALQEKFGSLVEASRRLQNQRVDAINAQTECLSRLDESEKIRSELAESLAETAMRSQERMLRLDRYEKGDTKQWIRDELELRADRDQWKGRADQLQEERDEAVSKLGEALDLMEHIKADLLDRAGVDEDRNTGDRIKVVNLSNRHWVRLCDFLVERQ